MANFSDEFDPDKTKEDVAKRLEQSFPDRDASEVREVAAQTVDEFADAPVKGFVEPVAEHEARERLRRSEEPTAP